MFLRHFPFTIWCTSRSLQTLNLTNTPTEFQWNNQGSSPQRNVIGVLLSDSETQGTEVDELSEGMSWSGTWDQIQKSPYRSDTREWSFLTTTKDEGELPWTQMFRELTCEPKGLVDIITLVWTCPLIGSPLCRGCVVSPECRVPIS